MGRADSEIKTVLLFDGVCNLCNRSINWIIDRDPASRIRFLPLQSPAGRALAARAGLDPEVLTTMVAIRGGTVLLRSGAALHVGTQLDTPLALAAKVAKMIPVVLRDAGYRLVARSRYAAFGKLDACRVPTPELASRFLDAEDVETAFRVAGLALTPDHRSAEDGSEGVRASAG
jgi:predicted DCC family thiol-disulfide oxidoreductase YuxK